MEALPVSLLVPDNFFCVVCSCHLCLLKVLLWLSLTNKRAFRYHKEEEEGHHSIKRPNPFLTLKVQCFSDNLQHAHGRKSEEEDFMKRERKVGRRIYRGRKNRGEETWMAAIPYFTKNSSSMEKGILLSAVSSRFSNQIHAS